ncbi:MAG: 50S ribosomal protein L32 [Patescibacteria group bacterium]
MGGVPVKHHTKSKVGRRRSHLALKPSQIFVCKNCKYPILPHKMCANCGSYKDKVIKAKKVKVKK